MSSNPCLAEGHMSGFFARQVEQRTRCQSSQAEDLQGLPLAEVVDEARPQAQEVALADKHRLAPDDLMGEESPIAAFLLVHLLLAALPVSLQGHVVLTVVQSWALTLGLSLVHRQDDPRYLSHFRPDRRRARHVRVADLAELL